MKLRWICAIAVVGLGLMPTSAGALTIGSEYDAELHIADVWVEADPGEANDLHISVDPNPYYGGNWHFRDDSAVIADAPCRRVDPHEVICPNLSSEYLRMYVDLGDSDDHVTLPPAANDSFFESFTVDGGAGNDTIVGGAQDAHLSGGDGDDTIRGGAGDESIEGDAGTDTVDGGPGIDVVTAFRPGRLADDPLSLDLTAPSPALDGDSLRNVEGIDTDGGRLHFRGGPEKNRVEAGNLTGGRIELGAGNDRAHIYGSGRFGVDLGAGDDALEIDGGHGTVSCGPGRDSVDSVIGVLLATDCERWGLGATVDLPLRPAHGRLPLAVHCSRYVHECRLDVHVYDWTTGAEIGRAKTTLRRKQKRVLTPRLAHVPRSVTVKLGDHGTFSARLAR